LIPGIKHQQVGRGACILNVTIWLLFKDGGKITLQADTVFAIEDINIEKGKAGSGNAFFRLVKGGVRALTGLIGW